jgi:hypothetical protein
VFRVRGLWLERDRDLLAPIQEALELLKRCGGAVVEVGDGA